MSTWRFIEKLAQIIAKYVIYKRRNIKGRKLQCGCRSAYYRLNKSHKRSDKAFVFQNEVTVT